MVSEFEYYQNTKRVEKMRSSVVAGSTCCACGQMVRERLDGYKDEGPGPYCIICYQKIAGCEREE